MECSFGPPRLSPARHEAPSGVYSGEPSEPDSFRRGPIRTDVASSVAARTGPDDVPPSHHSFRASVARPDVLTRESVLGNPLTRVISKSGRQTLNPAPITTCLLM